jgi:hypothetical protein
LGSSWQNGFTAGTVHGFDEIRSSVFKHRTEEACASSAVMTSSRKIRDSLKESSQPGTARPSAPDSTTCRGCAAIFSGVRESVPDINASASPAGAWLLIHGWRTAAASSLSAYALIARQHQELRECKQHPGRVIVGGHGCRGRLTCGSFAPRPRSMNTR